MSPPKTQSRIDEAQERIGMWLVGARGAVATTVAYGLEGLRQGLVEPVGLTTEVQPLTELPLASWGQWVLGGHDVCRRDMTRSAAELERQGLLAPDLVVGCSAAASAYGSRIRPGILDGPDVGVADLEPRSAELGSALPRQQIAGLREDLQAFAAEHGLARVVVVNLASTEALRADQPEWERLGDFERALDEGKSQPASVLYAYAAFQEGYPFVNFTPNPGSSIPALRELALQRGLPHCGNDGKTGETLVKTVLAPMFTARGLKVLSWQGYNMLGNRDGEVLNDPVHRESKLRNKDEALRSILDDRDTHTGVGIDYVPSLGDWKTAWDFIHFQGFLGVKMSLQFTWQGCDSALAAPLVLDLARLADLAARRGEAGVMEHTACFFKAPVAGGVHDFQAQVTRLREYARAVADA